MTKKEAEEAPGKFEKAHQIICELAKTGFKSFRMSIPARPNEDTDLVLVDALRVAKDQALMLERAASILEDWHEDGHNSDCVCTVCEFLHDWLGTDNAADPAREAIDTAHEHYF